MRGTVFLVAADALAYRRAPTLALEAFEPLSAAAAREFAAAYAQYPRE